MTITVYIDPHTLRPRFNEWPEMGLGKSQAFLVNAFGERRLSEEEQRLEKAISESVYFSPEDEGNIKKLIGLPDTCVSHNNKFAVQVNLTPNTFYSFEYDGKVDVCETCGHDSCHYYGMCDHCKEPIKVARLVTEKEETNKKITIESLLERASWLVGNPGTNISLLTDVACINWHNDFKKFSLYPDQPSTVATDSTTYIVEVNEVIPRDKTIKELQAKVKELEEEIGRVKQKSKVSPCPKCGCKETIMFTPDLDICKECHHKF